MQPPRTRTVLATVTVAAAFATGVASTAAQATAPNTAAAITARPLGAPTTTVFLPTGDQVAVTSADGHTQAETAPGGSEAYVGFDDATGDHYVVPAEAQPWFGRGLDRSLFDVTALAVAAAKNPQDAARIPVTLAFRPGTAPSAPPGVTLTGTAGSTATGYLTPASAADFTRALRRQIAADVTAGRKPGSSPLFGGLVSMASATATPTPVTPQYALNILQINTLDDTGAPDFALLLVVNQDNSKAFNADMFSVGGVAKAAVPAGHYTVLMGNFVFNDLGYVTRQELVSATDVRVSAHGAVPPVTLDARTATSVVTAATDQPATRANMLLSETVVPVTGPARGADLFVDDPSIVLAVAPHAKSRTGSFGYGLTWIGQAPATAAKPYQYDLGFTADHIAADQSYRVADTSLATIEHTFALDPAYGPTPQRSSLSSGFVSPFFGDVSRIGVPLGTRTLTDYVTPGLQWTHQLWEEASSGPGGPGDPGGFTPPIGFSSEPVTLAAGQHAARTWSQPIVPEFGTHPAKTVGFYTCEACADIADGTMDLVQNPMGDGNPDTTGVDPRAIPATTVYVDGRQVATTATPGVSLVGVPATAATIRYVQDVDRTSEPVAQSTKSHTDVTFRYTGQSDPSALLPSGTHCYGPLSLGIQNATCQVLPVLTIGYQLGGLDAANTSHAPTQNLALDVSHLTYGGFGSHAAITGTQVAVSFDGGSTWQNVPTLPGTAGHYTAGWTNPAAGTQVTMRVTATDALGGSITQTVTAPYTVG